MRGPKRETVRVERRLREGYRVMRFWNNDVLTNREGVLLTILEVLE